MRLSRSLIKQKKYVQNAEFWKFEELEIFLVLLPGDNFRTLLTIFQSKR